MTTYNDWLDGNAPDAHALRELLNELGETESEIKAHERNKEELRKRIDRVVSQMGGRAQVDGLATVSIVGGGERVSWSTAALDELIASLVNPDTGEIVEGIDGATVVRALVRARKVTSVKASLRVEFERGRK